MSMQIYLLIIFFGFLLINHLYETIFGEKEGLKSLGANTILIIGENAANISKIKKKFETDGETIKSLVGKIQSTKDQNIKTKMTTSSSAGRSSVGKPALFQSGFENRTGYSNNISNMGSINSIITEINKNMKIICNEIKCSGINTFKIPTLPNSNTLKEGVVANKKVLKKYVEIEEKIKNILPEIKSKVNALNKGNEDAAQRAADQRGKFAAIRSQFKK